MRFETLRHARSWLSLTVAAAAAVCLADFDVAVVVEGGALQHWTVSADGATWTQRTNILASTNVRQMAAPGDGYVYMATGSAIERYQLVNSVWSKKDNWKSGLSGKVRLVMSPDRVWFYLADDWGGQSLQRFRVSDPSIGGNLTLPHTFSRCRHYLFGRDGILYCGARGANVTDKAAANYGVKDTQRGVMAFDPTVAGAPLQYRCPLDGDSCGVGVIVDDDHGRLCAVYAGRCFEFGMGGANALTSTTVSGMSNPFYGVDLDGLKFIGDYNTGCVWQRDLGARTMKKITTVAKMCALSDITLVRTADSQLPNINGVWYMNETAGTTTLVNGANPGVWDMTLSGNAKAGATGACRGGVMLRGRDGGEGKGVIANSAKLVPGTGDFTIALWAYVGIDTSADRTLFSNGTASIGMTMSGKPYFRLGDGTELSIYGTSATHNQWAWIVVRRNGGKFEIWVNNAKCAEAAYNAATSIASDHDWTLGAKPLDDGGYTGYVTEGFFDELRVYPALLTEADMSHLQNLVNPMIFADSTNTKIRPNVQAPVGWQVSGIALDGVAYAAVNGQLLAYNGAGWTDRGAVGVDAPCLFVDDGKLYAVGRNSAGKLALVKATISGGTVNWSVPSVVGSGLYVPNLVSTHPAISGGRVWLGAPAQGAWDASVISFAFAGGVASDPQVSRDMVPTKNGTTLQSHVEATCVQALAHEGNICTLAASKRAAAARGESLLFSTQADTAAQPLSTFDGTVGFPAGSKPFGVVWDETTRRFWMVSAAWHRKDKYNAVPFFNATSIALYSSPDLYDWTYHGDFTESGTGFYYRPTPIILGNDLVVAFAGAIYASWSHALKIPNFRDHWNENAKRKRELLLADEDELRVWKYVYEPDIHEWVPSGIFCRGSYVENGVTHKLGIVQTIRQWKDRVFVNSRTQATGVFEFKLDGTFVKYYNIGTSTDGLGVSQDGKKVYATQWWGPNVYIIDRATGTVMTKSFGSALSIPRGIADIGGGRIAIGSRGTNQILVWEPENDDRVTTYGSADFGTTDWKSTGNGPQDIQFDAKTGRLWMSGESCGMGYIDFSANPVTYTRVGNTTPNGFTWWDDILMGTVYTPGRLLQSRFADGTLTADAIDAIGAGRLFNRVQTITVPVPATTIIVR